MGVVLIGMMGSGKSTVGARLAEECGGRFIDLDDLMEFQAGMTIRQIFEERGEQGFRELERAVLNSIVWDDRLVLAAGGGTPAFHNNFAKLKQLGTVVYLKVTPESLVDRLRSERQVRPLLDDNLEETLKSLLAKRDPTYRKADVIVDAERPVNEIVADIRRVIGW
jgi:shikimate kinase